MNLALLVLLVPIGVAVICDLRTGEIPDWIPLAILAGACLAAAAGLCGVCWMGVLTGGLLGLGLAGVVFYLGGLGGGDVKLLSAIGAAVGPGVLLPILAWTAVGGAILAFVALARGKRRFAYGPAIALGLLVETAWPGGLAHVLLH